MILTFVGQSLLRLFAILCNGSIPCSRSSQRTLWNNKQGGLRNVGAEWSMRNSKRRSARKSKKISVRGWRRWIIRRWRNVKLTGRESERGHAVWRKPGPMQLGRANILGALSRVVSCNPGIIHSIGHGRFRCNKKLPCRVHMPLQLVVYVFSWELDSVL